jgi:hypothetical protein
MGDFDASFNTAVMYDARRDLLQRFQSAPSSGAVALEGTALPFDRDSSLKVNRLYRPRWPRISRSGPPAVVSRHTQTAQRSDVCR